MIKINKQLAVVEDLELGFGEVTQKREISGGSVSDKTYHKINAEKIPALTFNKLDSNIQKELDERITYTEADAKYALIHGDLQNVFSVATPATPNHAVNKLTLDADIKKAYDLLNAAKAEKSNVLLRDNTVTFIPTGDYQPATKKYVDAKVVAVGAGDMAKTIYDHDGNGVVDNAEAIDGVKSDKIHMLRPGITDLDTVSSQGDWEGAIANGPAIKSFVSNFSTATMGYQFGTKDTHLSFRVKDNSVWGGWEEVLTSGNVVNNLNGSNDPNAVLSAKQGKLLSDQFMSIEGIPSGSIVIWSKPIIPKGWVICDGTNNTPDLQDKFVKGVLDASKLGTEGGSKTSTMPLHTHSLSVSDVGINNRSGWSFMYRHRDRYNPQETITVFHDAHASGNSRMVNTGTAEEKGTNEPQHVILYYIMKV